MEKGTYRIQDLKQYLINRDRYTREERTQIRNYFLTASLEQKEFEFTPIPTDN